MQVCDLLLSKSFSILFTLDIIVGILEGVGAADRTRDGERSASTFAFDLSSIIVAAADLVLVTRRGLSTARRFVARAGNAASGGAFRVKGVLPGWSWCEKRR
jgi:hypothetical protein